MPSLPPSVLRRIFVQLRPDGYNHNDDLETCSLVSKDWAEVAQAVLHEEASFRVVPETRQGHEQLSTLIVAQKKSEHGVRMGIDSPDPMKLIAEHPRLRSLMKEVTFDLLNEEESYEGPST